MDAIAIAAHMNTTDRLQAAWELVTRARTWVAACTTDDLLAGMAIVVWAETNHAEEC